MTTNFQQLDTETRNAIISEIKSAVLFYDAEFQYAGESPGGDGLGLSIKYY